MMQMKYIRILHDDRPANQLGNWNFDHVNGDPCASTLEIDGKPESCVPLQSPPVPSSQNGSSAHLNAQPHPSYGPAFTRLKTPCHVWQRSFDEDGYGYFRHKGKVIRAHIHYYVGKFGPVPVGMELDHTCRNRACVNPDHLEAVTHLENCRRGRLVKTGMTIEKARTAREMKAAGKTQREIGAHLGIGISLVAQIVGNRCWKDALPLAQHDPAKGVQS